MYWAFRLHHIKPSDFYSLSWYEKIIMTALIEQEIEDVNKERQVKE
jgi:hypothetical protein